MKKIVLFFLVVAALIAASAFLAPIFYLFLPFKFEKILNRLLMISAVAVFFTFARPNRSLFSACGFSGQPAMRRRLGYGLMTSFFLLALLALTERAMGVLGTAGDFRLSPSLIFSSFLTAVVVGATEEFFFRGFIYLKLNQCSKPAVSLVATNLFYAAVHFLRSGHPYVDQTPTAWDSVRVIGANFHAFLHWGTLWPSFIGLFLFGMVLSSAFLRTKSLYLSIGVHAGAVFFLKLTSHLFVFLPGHSALFYGGKGFYSGIFGWVFILLIGLVIWLVSKPVTPVRTT